MLRFILKCCEVIAFLLSVFYCYQSIYLIYGIFHRKKVSIKPATKYHRYAVLICARNEEEVIGELIHSLNHQNYPKQYLDIFVVADNCTDNTAQVARDAGASVYERFNQHLVGKGYALDYVLRLLHADEGKSSYDGFFVFDADNIVDENFVNEMNKIFDSGKYHAITCYRNSKNYASNWISAGYSLWFLREARFLNFPRMSLGSNCAISGTGFLISSEIVCENNGWPYHLLTEDIEFSVNCALKGQRIGYCENAIIYDEQPTDFKQSWDQRLRWSKGFYQIDAKYGLSLLKGCFNNKSFRFSCYDMLMTVAPGMLFTSLALCLGILLILFSFTQPNHIAKIIFRFSLHSLLTTLTFFYLSLFMYGCATTLCEWNKINATFNQKLIYLFTFPIFLFTYIPITLVALVKKVEWKPIKHTSIRKINK